jgi:hypothetical protein
MDEIQRIFARIASERVVMLLDHADRLLDHEPAAAQDSSGRRANPDAGPHLPSNRTVPPSGPRRAGRTGGPRNGDVGLVRPYGQALHGGVDARRGGAARSSHRTGRSRTFL